MTNLDSILKSREGVTTSATCCATTAAGVAARHSVNIESISSHINLLLVLNFFV